MDVHIETVKPGEAAAVYQVFSHARSQMTYLPHLHSDEDTKRYIAGLITEGNVFVAKEGDRILGFTQLKDGWVMHLYIDPAFQNKGIGKLLLDRVKEQSPSGLSLWVFEDNKGAIAFYEREGFVLSEKRDLEHTNNEEYLPDRKYTWSKK